MIEDRPGGPADSMGTAFAVDRDGAWLTAEHVTHGCTRVGLEDGRFARPVARVLESYDPFLEQARAYAAAMTEPMLSGRG